MKKSALLLAPLILGGLASCGANSIEKVSITFGREYDSSLTDSVEQHFDEITLSQLRSLTDSEKNFILLVYDKNSTCSCWGSLSRKIDEFMKKYDARIFGIQFSLLDTHESDFGLTLSSGNNTIAIFQDGAVKYQYVTVQSNEPLSEGEAFEEWMTSRVSFSNFNYVTLSQLNELFKGDEGEEFTVYFGRSTCGDCAFVESHLLKSYLASTPLNNKIYALECDVEGIRYNEDGEYDADMWQAFKDLYGLSTTNNEAYGYGVGYVPTFARYMPTSGSDYASVLDMAVYLNDTIDSEKMEVATSYYDGTREHQYFDSLADGAKTNLVGIMVDGETELDENGNWKKESAAVYHDPLLTAFLDFYGGSAN